MTLETFDWSDEDILTIQKEKDKYIYRPAQKIDLKDLFKSKFDQSDHMLPNQQKDNEKDMGDEKEI